MRLFPRKMKSRRSGPPVITQVLRLGVFEVSHPKKGTFNVNDHHLKKYINDSLKIRRF